jgi:hypothetical protein
VIVQAVDQSDELNVTYDSLDRNAVFANFTESEIGISLHNRLSQSQTPCGVSIGRWKNATYGSNHGQARVDVSH